MGEPTITGMRSEIPISETTDFDFKLCLTKTGSVHFILSLTVFDYVYRQTDQVNV